METMGKKWVFGIGLYLILKGVLNLILGFSVSNIIMLIVGVVVISVVLALLLNKEFKGRSFFRTLYFLPAVLSTIFCEVLRKKGWIKEGDLKL